MWLKDPCFKPLVDHEWNAMGGLSLPLKLKGLQNPIKAWNKEHFGCIDYKLRSLEIEIERLDKMADCVDLNETHWSRKKALESRLLQWKGKKT